MINDLRINIKPSGPHRSTDVVQLREVILGGQDGVVNTLGVLLGIAVASNDLRIILAGGLAAAFAESISMAAVAYTTTRTQQSLYEGEKAKERREIKELSEKEKEEIRDLYKQKGFSGEILEQIVDKITSDEEVWLHEMLISELNLEPVEIKHAFLSSAVVGVAAIIGSLLPLVPFFFISFVSISITQAIWISLVISAITLFVVGAYKAKVTIGDWKSSGAEIAIIGIVSALVGYVIGYLFKAPASS